VFAKQTIYYEKLGRFTYVSGLDVEYLRRGAPQAKALLFSLVRAIEKG